MVICCNLDNAPLWSSYIEGPNLRLRAFKNPLHDSMKPLECIHLNQLRVGPSKWKKEVMIIWSSGVLWNWKNCSILNIQLETSIHINFHGSMLLIVVVRSRNCGRCIFCAPNRIIPLLHSLINNMHESCECCWDHEFEFQFPS